MVFEIKQDVRLAEHCRFAVGGPADWFAEVSGLAGLERALEFARQNGLDHFVYAGGSNVFFDDAGFRGIVIRFVNGGFTINEEDCTVAAGAGQDLPNMVREVGRQGYGGIEFLGNIPGSVGGAVVGNAGCYGKEVSSILNSAMVYNITGSRLESVDPGFFEFSYRNSKLKQDPSLVVLEAEFKLLRRSSDTVLQELEEELELRLGKHPHEAQCAGSFFKNPSRDNPAWKLITEAGMAEARVGGARLSEMHANFLVNNGGATSADILSLVGLVQDAVEKHSGYRLSPEVRYVSPLGIQEIP